MKVTRIQMNGLTKNSLSFKMISLLAFELFDFYFHFQILSTLVLTISVAFEFKLPSVPYALLYYMIFLAYTQNNALLKFMFFLHMHKSVNRFVVKSLVVFLGGGTDAVQFTIYLCIFLHKCNFV